MLSGVETFFFRLKIKNLLVIARSRNDILRLGGLRRVELSRSFGF